MTLPLIVGAGPAGCAAALALHAAGAPARLVERNRAVGDAICGGFLSWRTLARLDRLGLPQAALGGHVVRRVRLFARQRRAEAALPATGQAGRGEQACAS